MTNREDVDITVENVKKKLDDIDCSKSCGPDNIPGSVLKKSSDIFTPILCQICSNMKWVYFQK